MRCPGFKEARVRTLDYSLLAVRSASIRGLAFSETDHKKCWEEIGSPEHCPICEYVATNNLRQIPFLIVVREALGNIYLAANKNSTPLQASASMGDVSHHLLS